MISDNFRYQEETMIHDNKGSSEDFSSWSKVNRSPVKCANGNVPEEKISDATRKDFLILKDPKTLLMAEYICEHIFIPWGSNYDVFGLKFYSSVLLNVSEKDIDSIMCRKAEDGDF